MQSARKYLISLSVVTAVICIGIFLSVFLGDSKNWMSSSTTQEAAYKKCVSEMQRKTCRILFGPEIAPVAAGLESFSLAGFGEVKTSLYRELKALDVGMCTTLQAPCSEDTSGDLCRLAMSLFTTDD